MEEDIIEKLIVGNLPDFSKRVIFLDFDGVINLGGNPKIPDNEKRTLRKARRSIPHTGKWENFVVDNIRLSFFVEVVDFLRDKNCLWLTSWSDLTQSKLNPLLGLNFGYVDWKYRGPSDFGTYGKVNSAEKIVRASGCDWMIIDDEMPKEEEFYKTYMGKEGKFIVPNSEVGLSIEECELIEEILSEDTKR